MRRRGATLIELIVVSGVFLAMVTAIWLVYSTAVNVEHNVSLKVDVDREIYAAVRHVDALLKTSRLVQPSDWFSHPQPVTTLELLPLAVGSDGQPQITVQGYPQWGPSFTIVFDNQELVRVTSDERRRLANLGEHGKVSFLRTSLTMLSMEIQVDKTGFRDETTSRDLTFQLRLFNQ